MKKKEKEETDTKLYQTENQMTKKEDKLIKSITTKDNVKNKVSNIKIEVLKTN